MNWDQDFAGLPPIKLPDGRELETLADLRGYILKLPERQQQEARWQHAIVELLKAAERGGGLAVLRTVGLRKGTAWRLRGWSDPEGAGQERGLEGEASSEEATMKCARCQDHWWVQ